MQVSIQKSKIIKDKPSLRVIYDFYDLITATKSTGT